MKAAVIVVSNVSKGFRYWHERPSSIKTFLVDIMKAKFSSGTIGPLSRSQIGFLRGKRGRVYWNNGKEWCGQKYDFKVNSGIYQPDEGKITVTKMIAPLIELGAGFNGELSGYENIFLNASILGFGRAATNAASAEIIEFSELGDKIHMPVKNYSSGMLVRLGFSIATHLEAPILLVDEILAVGDEGFQRKCISKIKELHALGRTIVLITHSPEHVEKHCSRCIIFEKQTKVFDGDAPRGPADTKVYLRINSEKQSKLDTVFIKIIRKKD